MTITLKNRFPFIFFLISQVLSLVFIKMVLMLVGQNINSYFLISVHLLISTFISQIIFKLPKWFLYISILFPSLIFISLNFVKLNAGFYGFTFFVLAITFSHTLIERVPLYLSNQTTFTALKKIVRDHHLKSFVDLGSGTGRVVRALSSHDINSFGVETAPSLFLFSSLLSFGRGKILRKSIWEINLENYECVYTFLSPAVMDKIGEKFQKEMKSGTLLISNSFPIESIRPTKILTLEDQRKTKLYLYLKN